MNLEHSIDKVQELGRHLPQQSLPTMSFLLEGMYARQCLIPAGTLFVGREHKKPHYFICAAGAATVTTESGLKQLRAGMVLMVEPGYKRMGITTEDTVFITVHRTDETDLKNIEDDLVVMDPNSRFGVGNELLPKELTCA